MGLDVRVSTGRMDRRMISFVELQPNDVTFTVEMEPEYEDPRRFFDDSRDVEFVLQQIKAGNDWEWCTVKVTARYQDFKGVAYLGACSYEDEKEFLKDASYEDMCADALARLNAELAAMVDRLRPFVKCA